MTLPSAAPLLKIDIANVRSFTGNHSAQTFAACVSVTRPGGTISNVGYHGDGDSVPIPRLAWGVGMSDKTIRTALCPGGSERMGRLLCLIETGSVDPLALTTHRFPFEHIEKAFRMMQTKEDGILKQSLRIEPPH